MKSAWTYRWADLPWLALGAISYTLLIKLLLTFYSNHALVTVFWPGAGLALAILLVGGRKFWPSILVGAFVGNFWAGLPVSLVLFISIARVLEALLGVWLLTRKESFDISLSSFREFFRLVFLAGALSPFISALIGITVLLHFGYIAENEAAHEFVQWWMGDLLGIVVVAPLVMVWRNPPRKPLWSFTEFLALFAMTLLIGQIIFLDWFSEIFGSVNRGFWAYPVICWAAVRFGLHGALIILLVTTVQALVGAALGIGTYGHSTEATQLINFWAHTLILTVIGIALAIVFAERERITTERQTSENRFLSLFENMFDAYSHCRLIYRDGIPADYEFITVNPAFEKISGLKDVVGRKISEIVPGYAQENQDSLRVFANVVQTGVPTRWEHFFAARDRWFSFAIYRPAPGEFICLFENISERKQTEIELRKLSLAVTQCPVSIVITDLDARIEYVNPAFVRVSGYRADEVIGQNPRVLKSGHTPQKTFDTLWATLRAGHIWRGELINRRKDGQEFIEDATISPLRQADGRITHYVGVKTDITELKRAMAELHSSEERFLLARNAAGLGLYDLDILTGKLDVDERIRAFWGVGPNEPFDLETFAACLHPDDRAGIKAILQQSRDPASDGKFSAEYRVISRIDGRVHHISDSGQVHFEDGKAIRAIGIVRDISVQKQLEMEVHMQRSEMENFVHQQVAAQTAAAIAHELNQPLVAISAYSEAALRMLGSGTKDPVKFEYALQGAMTQAQRAGRTLNELLGFLHKSEVVRAPVDLNEVIRSALAIAQENNYGGFHSVVELEQGLPPVQANRLQLQKVLVNLFHNGVEAMRNAGIPSAAITIKVQTMADKNMAQVTIQDRGPGFDAQTVHRIFDPFFTTKPNGLGLGLAISRSLIEANGGRLWADIETGPGATFHIALPFAS